jgi:hypothetical protein
MRKQPRCTRCRQLLRGAVTYLELDQRTGHYRVPGSVPPEHSQGAFPFGWVCARQELKSRAGGNENTTLSP